MNFINPLFLIGLFAASIPVLLHLLNLRKLKNIEFSSLKFLKELQKTKIKRLKIKQIILLILRTLIITFTVLAFARPIIEGSIPGFENYAKSSIIILIDNSYSMDVSDELGNRFVQAKKSAEKIINSMKEGDEALIVEMSSINNSFQPTFTKNKDLLIQSLSQIKLQPIPASLDNSMRLAAKFFQHSNNFAKELFVISDAQKNVFHSEDSLKLDNKNIAIYFIPIGYSSSNDFENLSVDSIDVLTRFFTIGKTVELSVTVKNHSEKDVKGALISLLFNKQKVAQKSFDISANSTKTIPIAAQ
ncbi:MAG: BatA domain-containing protein, partial [Ignavibacteria bacterium]|nr:BatA domain-containing protein [Ignavibacteria bacterium]